MEPYWQNASGSVRLYLGDARDVAPQFTERGHVIMDPPYSAHVHGKSRAGARKVPLTNGKGVLTRGGIDRTVDFEFAHLTAAERRMLAGHAARLCSRWAITFSDTESSHLWRRSFEANGLEYVRTAFWHKIAGSPQFTGDRPAVACEAITLMHPAGRKRWNGGGKLGIYSETVVQPWTGDEPRIHTTQKPERLMLALVEDFTDPGDLVYDLTAGSCTTGIACMRAKGGPRRFVGIERDEKFAERAAKRLEAETKGSTYHAQERGQQALFT